MKNKKINLIIAISVGAVLLLGIVLSLILMNCAGKDAFYHLSSSEDPVSKGVVSKETVSVQSASSKAQITKKQITMPNLINKSLEEAIRISSELNFQLTIKEDFHPTVPKGMVASQNAEAGKKLYERSIVEIIVSKGPDLIIVPNVTGLPVEKAKEAFSNCGINCVTVLASSQTVPDEIIISQQIPANQKVPRNSTVSLTVSAGKANFQGNSSGNINNDGLVASQGDWIYYSVSEKGVKCIYKTKKDGSKTIKICNNLPYNAFYLNVVGEHLYFAAYNNAICKVNIDGTNLTELLRQPVNSMLVVGDTIYYTTMIVGSNDGQIYKMRTDGSGKMLVCSDRSAYINVVGDWIYYRNNNDHSCLYKIKIDGSQKTMVFSDIASCINVVADKIYFSDRWAKLCQLSLENPSEIVTTNQAGFYLNLCGDYLVGSDVQSHTLFKIKKDGTGKQILVQQRLGSVVVIDEWVYYSLMGTGTLCRIKIDGTSNQVISE